MAWATTFMVESDLPLLRLAILKQRLRGAGSEQLEPVSSVAAEGRSEFTDPIGHLGSRLRCEPLESRQLLSVAQASLGALGVSNPIVAQARISIPTRLPWLFCARSSTAVDVEIGQRSLA